MPGVIIEQGGQGKMKNRRPNFMVHGKMKPYGLYPLMIHPVLPKETLQNFTMKGQFVSSPIVNPLIGSWMDLTLWYVKVTDLDPALSDMFLSDTFSTSGYTATADDEKYFVKTGQIKWTEMCVERIHDIHFLPEGWTALTMDDMPRVRLDNSQFLQNAIFKPADVAVVTDDAVEAGQQLSAADVMRQMTMADMTYENWLKSYGVTDLPAAQGVPELLGFQPAWTMPVNTVDPATGTPSSAWIWRPDWQVKQAKRFNEAGFLICLGVVRPKMYQHRLEASLVGEIWGFSDWIPAFYMDKPEMFVREMAGDNAIFHTDAYTTADDFQFDYSDLWVQGEQFINNRSDPLWPLPFAKYLSTETGGNDAKLRGAYANGGDVTAMFSTPGDSFIEYDGICRMTVSGHIRDMIRA